MIMLPFLTLQAGAIMHFALNNHLSYAAMGQLLHLLKVHLPSQAGLPKNALDDTLWNQYHPNNAIALYASKDLRINQRAVLIGIAGIIKLTTDS